MSISNLIFTACVACKNQVRDRQKIKFKNQSLEIEILKNQVQIDKGIDIYKFAYEVFVPKIDYITSSGVDRCNFKSVTL